MSTLKLIVRPRMQEGFKRICLNFAQEKDLKGFVKKVDKEDNLHQLVISGDHEAAREELEHLCSVVSEEATTNEVFAGFRTLKSNNCDHDQRSSGSVASSYSSCSSSHINPGRRSILPSCITPFTKAIKVRVRKGNETRECNIEATTAKEYMTVKDLYMYGQLKIDRNQEGISYEYEDGLAVAYNTPIISLDPKKILHVIVDHAHVNDVHVDDAHVFRMEYRERSTIISPIAICGEFYFEISLKERSLAALTTALALETRQSPDKIIHIYKKRGDKWIKLNSDAAVSRLTSDDELKIETQD